VATSSDRSNNLGFCMVVAAGHSPLRTYQTGHIHFEPFWSAMVAALSGWSPERVLALYPFLPLLMTTGFAWTLYVALRAPDGGGEAWSGWERVLIAGFATLLSSSPLEHIETYRVPWASTFLLKPNHALGLVMLPAFLCAFARLKTWRGRVAVGFLLHLIGWVFVLHMAFICVGLVAFALWTLLERRADSRTTLLDVVVVIGVNILVVSPYLYMLGVGYPLGASPRATIPSLSPHLLEPTTRYLPLVLLGAWGAFVAHRRGDRLGRVWSGQVVGALVVWLGHVVLSALELSRERDESYYWLRFLLAASAGVGAWDLACRFGPGLWRGFSEPARVCVAVCVVALPYSLPYWWNPLLMDSYFPASLKPLPERLTRPTDWIREHTDSEAVFAGDPAYARYVAALGARRVLWSNNLNQPADAGSRYALDALLVQDVEPAEALGAARRWGVRYLVVTPAWLAPQPGLSLPVLDTRRHLRRVFLFEDAASGFVAIYELVGERA
jgi:hypothetical protein